MFRNYLKLAYRGLLKNKSFTAINVSGLSAGIAACLLIVFYVTDELSFDRYNRDANRIYRINEDIRFAGNATAYAQTPAPLAAVVKSELPGIAEAVRIKSAGTVTVKKGNDEIREDKVAYADGSLFQVFTLPVVEGDALTALKEPYSVVLSETTARKYFNSTHVIGEIINLNNRHDYKITAVIKDIPQRSHFRYDLFLSMASLADSREDTWLDNNYNTYVLLEKETAPKQIEAQLANIMRRYVDPQLQSAAHLSLADFEKGGNFFRLSLIPLTDIHLQSSRVGELGSNGDKRYIYIFSLISIFILLVGCINFMNLSTARSADRAREAGVRKALGSLRKHLALQFLTESFLTVLVSTIFAVLAAWSLLPAFNQLAGKDLRFTSANMVWLIPVSLFGVAVISLLAGAYPAFFLSGVKPVEVLKGKFTTGPEGKRLRSGLVVFQFSISVFLIIATLVVFNQLNYIRKRDLGYDRDHVLVIKNVQLLGKQAAVLKQDLLALKGISGITMTGFLPTSGIRNSSALFQDQTFDQKKGIQSQTWPVDENYVPTLGLKLAAGRNFSAQYPTDSSAMIINQAAAKAMGIADPLNKQLFYPVDPQGKAVKAYHIIGVIKDFNFSSLRDNITPVVLTLEEDRGAISMRFKTDNIAELLSQVAQKWKALAPHKEFTYSFMDQDFERSYLAEQRTGKVMFVFTILTIIIACLGLFGLAAYTAEQRTKEIGIRKVLGAGTATIVKLLAFDFIKPVCVAVLLASPLAWYFMQKWLEDFAYSTGIQWWIIAVAGTAAILIAFLTISVQSVRAALLNPVSCLKNE